MSAILAWIPRRPDDVAPIDAARRAFGPMGGGSEVAAAAVGCATLGVARHPWEVPWSGPATVARGRTLGLVADASLYYRSDLRERLVRAGIGPVNHADPAELVLASLSLGAEEAVSWLEGDFAFVAWDEAAGRVVAARDFVGKRPLYYADTPAGLALASTVAGVEALTGRVGELNVVMVAAAAAGLPALDPAETHRAGVRVLPAGHVLTWTAEQGVELSAYWHSPEPGSGSPIAFDSAAGELLDLVSRAVIERLAPEGPTAVWLSGGWDSTAVMAAGAWGLRRSDPRALAPVSMSYPPGDPGREDEFIDGVALRHGLTVEWLSSEELVLFGTEEDVLDRPAPFAHAFERWLLALAQGARRTGARVVLDGYGGDQLFQVSDVYLADLIREGRLLRLFREWMHPRWRGRRGRAFFGWALQPGWPRLLGGRRWQGRAGGPAHLDRPLPPWLRGDFVTRHDLARRSAAPPRRPGQAFAGYELDWYLTHPSFPALAALVAEVGARTGVEVRSPLLDRRVVEFAARRPVSDRACRGETKRLLRRAMRGLVPPAVLAPRPVRTGITSGLFERNLRQHGPEHLRAMMQDSRLASAGIVEPSTFARHWEAFLGGEPTPWGAALFATLETERWLRAHEPVNVGGEDAVRPSVAGRDA